MGLPAGEQQLPDSLRNRPSAAPRAEKAPSWTRQAPRAAAWALADATGSPAGFGAAVVFVAAVAAFGFAFGGPGGTLAMSRARATPRLRSSRVMILSISAKVDLAGARPCAAARLTKA